MPTVTRENIGLLNDKITVTVSKEDYLPSFEKMLKDYAKQANIPGFRKGMVPTGIIRKLHGPAVFTEEVLRSVEKNLMNYLQTEKLDIFAQPLPAADFKTDEIKLTEPKEYSFAFEIGLKPGFEIADLKNAKVPLYKVNVTDEMVEEEVTRLRQRLGKMSEPETVTTEENVINVKFEASDAEGNVEEGTLPKDNSLLVKYFSEEFRKKLMGAKNDDHFVIQISSAFDEKEREWMYSDLGLSKDDPAAGEKYYRITITKVGLVEPRELNEEFYKEVLPHLDIKTEEEFRTEIKTEIQNNWDKQAANHLQHELYHILLDQTKMDFPEDFLRRWLLNGGEQPKTPEQVEEEFPTFRNQLRWTLISDKIVRDQDIQVSREDIAENMKQQVLGYFGNMGIGDNMDWIDSYVDRMMKDQNQFESTYRRLITEKVFDWAETQITPEEKSISAEDFNKILAEHKHEH